MTTARELIELLTGQGVSKRAIGRAIGRDSSYVSQVARGIKPGEGLTDALDELRRRLDAGQAVAPVTAPARRTKASGEAARVRRKTIVGGDSWATGNVKKQAAGSGARSLLRILRDAGDADVAATVSFRRGVPVFNSSGGRRKGALVDGAQGQKQWDRSVHQSATINLGNAQHVYDVVTGEWAGNVTAYVLDRMRSLAMIEAAEPADVEALELRVWQS